MERRAPIYLLLDCSGSMEGERIQALNNGLDLVIKTLRNDPECLEKVWLSIITFADDARVVLPLTPVPSIQIPTLKADGRTSMGAAIGLLQDCLEKDLIPNDKANNIKGDYYASVIIMTDGDPTDPDILTKELARLDRKKIKYFIGAAVDKANMKFLELITGNRENIIELSTADMNTFKRHFVFVTVSLSTQVAQTPGDKELTGSLGELPPLPNEEELL